MKLAIATYQELANYLRLFVTQDLPILVINSGPGQAKSTIVRNAIPEANILSGKLTAARLYDLLWLHKDKLTVFDDIDDIYRDKTTVNLLKTLCQTEQVKELTWGTRTKVSGRISPDTFETTSRVILLTNDWQRMNKHVAAVEDRGIVLDFKPAAVEVHNYAIANLANRIDTEVLQFIGQFLGFILNPSLRVYLTCSQMKLAAMDWQNAFFQSLEMDSETSLVFKLLLSEPNIKERKQQFVQQTGKTERTYYRIEAKLKKMLP